MEEVDFNSIFQGHIFLEPFYQRFPWIGGDLQTLRDSFVSEKLPKDTGERIEIPIPKMPSGDYEGGHLLAVLDRPVKSKQIQGLVLLLHGLGGSSRRQGLRRMGLSLVNAGFAVLRLNLRGADPGRDLAGGTYSARCNSDLIPAINYARKLCDLLRQEDIASKDFLPLFGVGISLGGTMLLNACLDNLENKDYLSPKKLILDGLVCLSSPLDLAECSSSIERPRNRIYQKWLLHRLIRQTLADPFGVKDYEKKCLLRLNEGDKRAITSIRDFDSVITAPRWGYKDVDDYYERASPLSRILRESKLIPESLFIQSLDDPWVPYKSAELLLNNIKETNRDKFFKVVLSKKGGHNGFHGKNGCWGDKLVVEWLTSIASKKY